MSDHCANQSESIERALSDDDLSPMDTGLDLAPAPGSRRRRSRRRRFVCPSKFLALALCLVAAHSFLPGCAFTSPSCPSRRSVPSRSASRRDRQSVFRMSSLAEPPPTESDFQRRMRGLVRRGGAGGARGGAGGRTIGQRAVDRPSNLKTVHTLMEFKEALDAAGDKVVVARFFATWCKACKAIQPAYHRMAAMYPEMVFLEVPVTNDNANLHQGLAVPSLPYGHIYHPDAGLVEELRISRKYFKNLVRLVRWYDRGECPLEEFVPEVEGDI